MSDKRFRVVAILTALAGTTLGKGIVLDSVPLIAIGAAMSAVFPWGVIGASLILRFRCRGC